MRNEYCFACGNMVEVIESKVLGGTVFLYCKAHFHFVRMEPDRPPMF